jgi:hypothetical protein
MGDEELRRLLATRAHVSERRWRANQGAELLPEGSGLFSRLREVCRLRETLPPVPGEGKARYYIKALDPARSGDRTSLAAFYVEGGVLKQAKLALWRDPSWKRQESRIREFCDAYPGELHIDATARIALVDRVEAVLSPRELVNPVTFTNTLKSNMVDHAVAMHETDKLLLLDPETSEEARIQYEELSEFVEKRTPSGLVKHEAPEGGHDDTVSAVIMAAWGARDALEPQLANWGVSL